MTMSEILSICFAVIMIVLVIILMVAMIVAQVRKCEPRRYRCDLCNGDKLGSYTLIRTKRYWSSFDEDGFVNEKICICENCKDSLMAAARKDRELRGEWK